MFWWSFRINFRNFKSSYWSTHISCWLRLFDLFLLIFEQLIIIGDVWKYTFSVEAYKCFFSIKLFRITNSPLILLASFLSNKLEDDPWNFRNKIFAIDRTSVWTFWMHFRECFFDKWLLRICYSIGLIHFFIRIGIKEVWIYLWMRLIIFH